MTDALEDAYDVVVVGGGAAGLSGALMLARARRSVAVVDAGSPRNAPAEGVHGLLGREGMSPLELVERGRAEVRGYGAHVVPGEVVSAGRGDDGLFVVGLADGRRVTARRLLVTTGVVDELPDIADLDQRWGRDVIHCPYCHGYEVRDGAVGVIATGPVSAHQGMLFRQWTEDLVFFRNDQELTDEEAEQLTARGVRLVEGRVVALEVADGAVTGVRLADGTVVPRDAIAVSTRLRVSAPFLDELGVEVADHPSGMGQHVPVDGTWRTNVAGVWAAGNLTDMSAQVGAAAAAGAAAGAQINFDLVLEETLAAVAASRAARPAPVGG
jgi:thioredoxin reductase